MNRAQVVYVKYIKRTLDVLISAFLLVVGVPVFGLIALWVRVDSPGPVLFRQPRIGRDKRAFIIIKFRTMRTDAPSARATHLLCDAVRHITRSGRVLRRTSLDELPQLLNVIKGEMSLVGPRPALYNQYDLIEARDQYGVNALRPGLTGWAQVNGRDELPIPVKARLDGDYARRIGFWMDARCVVKTFSNIIKSEGYVEGGSNRSA